ncbi:hypothetical protein D3C76_176260 [compost metagenome]
MIQSNFKQTLQLRINEIRAKIYLLQQEETGLVNALNGFEQAENAMLAQNEQTQDDENLKV